MQILMSVHTVKLPNSSQKKFFEFLSSGWSSVWAESRNLEFFENLKSVSMDITKKKLR